MDDDLDSFPFDGELISANKRNFEHQIQHVKKHFTPISIELLLDSLEGKALLPKRAILVTFDDGYDDNYFNAFPILKKYEVPATIFVSVGFVSTSKRFWFDDVAAIVKHTDEKELFITSLDKKFKLGDTAEERERSVQEITECLKRVSNEERIEVLSFLKKKYGEIFSKVDLSRSKALTWEQIKEMDDSVISFGSHTMTHPILTNLDKDELEYELVESKKILEKKLNKKIETFAYPNGGINDISDEVDSQLKSFGYKVSFSYLSGVNKQPVESHFRLKRIHIEHQMNRRFFNLLLCCPNVFSD